MQRGNYRIDWNLNNMTNGDVIISIEMTAIYNVANEVVSVIIMSPTDDQWTFELKNVRKVYANLASNGTIPAHSLTIVY